MNAASRIANRLRRASRAFFGAPPYSAANVQIHGTAGVNGPLDVDLRAPNPSHCYLTVGADCLVHGRFVFETAGGTVKFAARSYFGGSTVICRTRVSFGSNVFVAWGATFYDHDSHSMDFGDRRRDIDAHLSDFRAGRPALASKSWANVACAPIHVEDDAWIGMNALVLKGVTVGRGAIVGAGAVVAKDVPPWTVVVGNPARIVRELPPDLRDSEEPGLQSDAGNRGTVRAP